MFHRQNCIVLRVGVRCADNRCRTDGGETIWASLGSAVRRHVLSSGFDFLPHDTMLARYMLSSCVRLYVRPSVRPSVTSRYCIETTKRTELAFATQASFQLSRNLPWYRWKQLGKVKVAGTLNRTEQVEGLLFNYQQGNPMVGLGLEPFHGLFPPSATKVQCSPCFH